MTRMIHICDFRSEPGETECYTAVWSQGRDCKGCKHQCYRAGWEKSRVDRDNAAHVMRKRDGLPPVVGEVAP